jgi:integrase
MPSHVRLYLSPYLGAMLLAELSVAQVQAMFTAIARRHETEGKAATPATLNRIRATLRAALNAAIRQGLITDNPAARADLPGARRPRAVVWTTARVEHWQRTGERPPVAVWTAAQTAEFLHAIGDHRLYAAFHLIALRGLRRGEAAGLRWCDVDLDEGVAVISQQLQQYDGYLTVCPPKTARSARVIALDRTTVAALRGHRDRQRCERHHHGEGYRDSGYVFTGVNGDPMSPDRLTRIFGKLIAEHCLRPIPPAHPGGK